MMELVMQIGDIVKDAHKGNIVVGVNSQIIPNDVSKLCKLGERVIVSDGREKMWFTVLDIDVSFSVRDRAIISLRLKESEDFNKIKIGDCVFKV